MKILFVSEENYPCTESAMEGIFTKEHTPFIATFLMKSKSSLKSGMCKWGKATVITFPLKVKLKLLNTFSLYFFDCRYIYQMFLAIRRYEPEVLIVRDMTFPLLLALLFRPWYKYAVSYQKSHPFEVRNRNLQYINNYRLPSLYKALRELDAFLLHRLMGLSDVILPISTKMGEKLIAEHSVDKSRVYVLTMGIDKSILSKRAHTNISTKNNGQKYIYKLVYSGTLAEDRDIEQLIIGIKLLPSHLKEIIELNILGGTKDRIEHLKDLVIQEELYNQVFILGYKTRSEVCDCYATANIGISWVPVKERFIDSFPTKMIEYAAYGLPIIATKGICEHESMINKYHNGLLIGCSPEQIADGIEVFIKNHKQYRERSIEIAHEIQNEYSYDNIAQKLYRHFENSVGN